MEKAITIWVDESTEIKIDNQNYNLVGYLITNSDKEEFSFLNTLKQSRKISPACWTTLHGCEINDSDSRQFQLLDRWVQAFKDTDGVYFHAFLYKRNEQFIPPGETYEHYFAKQSVFALAHKMKKEGYVVNTMFKNVATLTVLFDRRRAHMAGVVTNDLGVQIDRINELESIYKDQICQQISNISGKNPLTNELTVRFSFLSSDCFDAMQLSDSLIYLMRKKIEQEQGGEENSFTRLFDKHFLNDLDPHTKDTGFRSIYAYSKKFNIFESNA